MWTTHSAEPAVHPIKRNGSAHVPAGTSQCAQRLSAFLKRSSRCANTPVEDRAGLEHRMHRDRQLTCHCNRRTLEADPLPELETPGPQAALGRAAGQDDGCRLKQKPSHMAIAPAGDMTVIVDLAGLVAPGGQAQPGADGTGPLEVVWILNGCRKRCRGDRPDTGIDMRMRQAWF
jgi:hypothetical protein